MIILKAKLRGIKEFITGRRLVFFVSKDDMTQDDYLSVFQEIGTDGFVTFTADKLKTEIELAMKNRKIGASEEGRSKSEILRGLLYRYWSAISSQLLELKGTKTFEEFYDKKMDSIITKIRQTVDQIEIENLDTYYAQFKTQDHDK